MKTLKLGKKPARPGSVRFLFSKYFDASKLPTPPASFGRTGLVRRWGMFANDMYGDCVWAGAAHETMLWTREQKRGATFSDKSVLAAYSEATGFNPRDPYTDQGTDMQAAASYRLKTGIPDAKGRRHKIDSYVAIQIGDLVQLKLAMWLMGGAGIGIQFPRTAMDDFDRRKPWTVHANDQIDGGHYVSGVGWKQNGNIVVVTWGRLQEMTPKFYSTYCDEVVAYLSLSRLDAKGLSPEGFAVDALRRDLAALRA